MSAPFLQDACAVLPEGTLLTGDACAPYETDVLETHGKAVAVALPSSREEVQRLVQVAHRHRVALVPQGNRTGLVGGAVADASSRQCIVSFRRMSRVRAFNALNRSITVESGLRLSELNRFAEEYDLHFPVDLGADPAVGGLVATNAGGSRLLKYGDVRRNVLGLEVVLADDAGTLLDMAKPLRKNNTGLDLKQLFVGGNGALGLVTAASLALTRVEQSRFSVFAAFRDYEAAAEALPLFESVFGELLGSFEIMAADALRAVLEAFPTLSMPLSPSCAPCFALIEVVSGMPGLGEVFEQRGLEALQKLAADGRVVDATVGAAERFWRIRDSLPVAAVRDAVPLTFDVSFARDSLVPFLRDLAAWLERAHPRLRRYEFGHFGDGGCHIIVAIPHACATDYPAMRQIALRSAIYERVSAHGGSFSAEHGIGPMNMAYYRKLTSPSERTTSAAVQTALDPHHVLGRCRYF